MTSLSASRWFLGVALTLTSLGVIRGVDAPPSAGSSFDVRLFGATGDGRSSDTAAINRTIAAAAAAGGGTVCFPAGTYLSASIHLRSRITLVFESGATLEAIDEHREAYDDPEPNPSAAYQDFGHSHFHNSLIWGQNLEDVAILGPGFIHGKALYRGYPNEVPLPSGAGDKVIALKDCRNVIIRDLAIFHAGHFGILATGVDNLTIDDVRIDTQRDGIDVDCCSNVRIANCSVNSPRDDAICLKSSLALGRARMTENVTVTNCFTSGYDEGTLLDGTRQDRVPSEEPGGPSGRIKLGTESNGGFRNIVISNCICEHSRGLALETVDGGILEDVSISNITMREVNTGALFIRLGARLRGPPGAVPGVLRRVNISEVTASGVDPRFGVIISGIPGHPIEDLSLSHIRILCRGGGTKEQAARNMPEVESEYPEPNRFGINAAYGMFCRHIRGLAMDHIEVGYSAEDFRPAFILDDVAEADLDHVKARHAAGVPEFVLSHDAAFALRDCPGLPDVRTERVDQQSF